MATGKAILVTGASSGIGAAIASRLARDGHRAVGTHRAGPARSAEGIELLTLDVGSDASVARCREAFLQRAGRLDVLVNNAGYLVAGPAVVAQAFSRIVRSGAPPLHTTVTREDKLVPFLRWLLPAAAFEGGVRRGCHLDRPSG